MLKAVELTVATGMCQLEKGFSSQSVVLPHLLLMAGQQGGSGSLCSSQKCCWENWWLTGTAGVFYTGKEREEGKVLE